jgi:hypothetical protein
MERQAITTLILGKIPKIEGSETRYPLIALQSCLSEFVNENHARNACSPNFKMFQQPASAGIREEGDYFQLSLSMLQKLGLVDEDGRPIISRTALTSCWELRENVPEVTYHTNKQSFMESFFTVGSLISQVLSSLFVLIH